MVVAAPTARLETRHFLIGGLAAGHGQHLQAFAFERALETPDAGGAGGEAVGELQVGHEIDHLLLGQRIQEAFGHQGHREHLALLDLVLGDGELRSARQSQAERLRVLELDDAAHGRAALELEDVELVILADDAVRVEHVLQQVVELADVGAGEARADLIADVAEGMTDAAGRSEELAARRDVALADGLGLEHRLVFRLGLREVGLGRVDHADDRGELRVQGLVAERLQLTHHERRKQGLVGLARGHGGEQRLAADGVAREGGDRVGRLFRGEGRQTSEQHAGRSVVADGGERLDERTTEEDRSLLGEHLMDHRSGGAVAGSDEHGERTLAGRERGFHIGEMAAVEGSAGFVAREGVEFVEVGEQVRSSALAQAGDERRPAFGRGESA